MTSAEVDWLASRLIDAFPFPGHRPKDVAEFLAAGRLERFQDGATLCLEGEPGDSMFILVDGVIDVRWPDRRGRQRTLAAVTAPAVIGHWCLIDGEPRAATCIAKGGVSAVVLNKRDFQDLHGAATSAGAAFRRLLLSSLSNQLSKGNQDIARFMAG